MSDYVTRLSEILDDLHQDAAHLERVGRALSDAELRRVDALRSAADLVQGAADALSDIGPDAAPPPAASTGQASAITEIPRMSGGDLLENSGLAGDDDTPGYDRDRGAY